MSDPIESAPDLNEAPTLREEESRARYDERMRELDRKDRAGPHDMWRD